MPQVSIVIVNYHTREPLRRTLESIRRERGVLDVEIIVVDNDSQDGSAEMVREAFPEVKLIEPGRNTWFTGGNNLGALAATGDMVLILNPDTVMQPGMLDTLARYLQEHPQVGAVGCVMRGLDGSLQRTCSKVPRFADLLLGYTFIGALLPFWRNRRRADMWYEGWERDTTRAVEVLPGSCILVWRDLLEQVGGAFDERQKLYFTEDDLCKRLLRSGREIHFVAEAMILHEEHVSIRLVQRLASQIYFDDLIIFARKWYGDAAALILQVLIIPTRVGMNLAQRMRGERASVS